MYTYQIYVRNGGDCAIFEVSGTDFAWEVYSKALALCELVDGACDLVDAETGEVIESFGYEYDISAECDPCDLEVGFDPYMGCYSDDC